MEITNITECEAIAKDKLPEMINGIVSTDSPSVHFCNGALISEHKYDITKVLQEKKHVVGMTIDGVNDASALNKTDMGIAVSDVTDAARSASDIVLTEPGLSVIISAVLISRVGFHSLGSDLGIRLPALHGFDHSDTE